MAMFTKTLVLGARADRTAIVAKANFVSAYRLWTNAGTGDLVLFAQATDPCPRARERCGDPRKPILYRCKIMRAGIVFKRSPSSTAHLVEFDRITPLRDVLFPSGENPLIFYRKIRVTLSRKACLSLFHSLGVPLSELRPPIPFDPKAVLRTDATDMRSASFIVGVLRRLSVELGDGIDESVNCDTLFSLIKWKPYKRPKSLIFMMDDL